MRSEVRSQCGHKWGQKIVYVRSECGHTGPSVARSDPDADICGDLLTKSLTSNKTKDEFFFVECISVVNHHFNITARHHRLAFYQNEQRGPSTFSLWSASLKTKGLNRCGGTSWVLAIRLPGYQLSLCLNCSYTTTFLACQGSISNTSFSLFFFQIHLLTQCDLHQPYCKVWVQSSDIFIILILNWMHSRVWYTGRDDRLFRLQYCVYGPGPEPYTHILSNI